MEEAEILLRNAMEHHGAAVYRLALCRMQSVQDAEDVYQDVFLRLLGRLGRGASAGLAAAVHGEPVP